MPWYRVRLRLVDVEVSAEQVEALRQAADHVTRRHDQLSVTVTTNAGDVSGAVARALNVIDGISGDVGQAEVTACEPPERPPRRRATAKRR